MAPSENSTSTVAASPITCALVAMRPSAEMTKPVPVPLPADVIASMRTTLGRTLSTKVEMSTGLVATGLSIDANWTSGVATVMTASGAEARPATAPPAVPPATATSARTTALLRLSRPFAGGRDSGTGGGPAGGCHVGDVLAGEYSEPVGPLNGELGGVESYMSMSFRVRSEGLRTILPSGAERFLNQAERTFRKPGGHRTGVPSLLAHCRHEAVGRRG